MSKLEEYNYAKTSWAAEVKTGRMYELPVKTEFTGVYRDRLADMMRSDFPLKLPKKFIEVGSDKDPLVRSAAQASMKIPVGERPQLEMHLFDFTYELDIVKVVAAQRIFFALGPSDEDREYVKALNLKELGTDRCAGESLRMLNKYARVRMIPAGLPYMEIPGGTDEYNLTFASVANYVDFDDLRRILSDSRIRSVAFVNGSNTGQRDFAHLFHPDRSKTTMELMLYLDSLGFLTVDCMMEVPGKDGRLPKTAPVMALFMVRPMDIHEAEWIKTNKHLHLINLTNGEISVY